MRKLILKMSMSLDGFVGGLNGENNGVFRSVDEGATAWTMESLRNASLHIMGSKTYRDMLAWWPTSDEVFAAPMNAIPKAVFTRHGAQSLQDLRTTPALRDASGARDSRGDRPKAADPQVLKAWHEPYVATGPIKDELARLKSESGGPMLVHGGAGFARSVIATGLVDEYRLLVHPIALGRGLPIFTELRRPKELKLLSSTSFASGTVAQVYTA